MASSMIHIAVANEINKVLKHDESRLFIGTIAPDISKHVGDDKKKSHFINSEENVPDLDSFCVKYKEHFDDDFVLGYYIHLYTDYLWEKYFISQYYRHNYVKTFNDIYIILPEEEKIRYIYNDYTNINIQLIDKYNLDLKIFYNELPEFEKTIEEIPMDKLKEIVDYTGVIVANSKENKTYMFDLDDVVQFIQTSVKLIISDLTHLGIIKE